MGIVDDDEKETTLLSAEDLLEEAAFFSAVAISSGSATQPEFEENRSMENAEDAKPADPERSNCADSSNRVESLTREAISPTSTTSNSINGNSNPQLNDRIRLEQTKTRRHCSDFATVPAPPSVLRDAVSTTAASQLPGAYRYPGWRGRSDSTDEENEAEDESDDEDSPMDSSRNIEGTRGDIETDEDDAALTLEATLAPEEQPLEVIKGEAIVVSDEYYPEERKNKIPMLVFAIMCLMTVVAVVVSVVLLLSPKRNGEGGRPDTPKEPREQPPRTPLGRFGEVEEYDRITQHVAVFGYTKPDKRSAAWNQNRSSIEFSLKCGSVGNPETTRKARITLVEGESVECLAFDQDEIMCEIEPTSQSASARFFCGTNAEKYEQNTELPTARLSVSSASGSYWNATSNESLSEELEDAFGISLSLSRICPESNEVFNSDITCDGNAERIVNNETTLCRQEHVALPCGADEGCEAEFSEFSAVDNLNLDDCEGKDSIDDTDLEIDNLANFVEAALESVLR